MSSSEPFNHDFLLAEHGDTVADGEETVEVMVTM